MTPTAAKLIVEGGRLHGLDINSIPNYRKDGFSPPTCAVTCPSWSNFALAAATAVGLAHHEACLIKDIIDALKSPHSNSLGHDIVIC